jgi:hypothetical protein
MRWQALLFLLAVLSIIVASVFQSSTFLTLWGTKPNLVLVLLAVFVFFVPDLFIYLVLVFTAGAFLRFSPGLGWDMVMLSLLGLFFFYMRDRFFSSGAAGSLVFTAFGTVLFYLLISPAFVYHEGVMVIKEVVYNSIIALIVFGIASFIYEKKAGSPVR